MTEQTPNFPKDFIQDSRALCAVFSAEGILRVCNEAWREALGYDPEGLCRGLYTELVHLEDLAITENYLEQALESGGATFSNRMRGHDGRFHEVAWQFTRADETIQAMGIVLRAADRAPINGGGRELADNQEFAAVLIQTSPFFLLALSPQGRLIMGNDTLLGMLDQPLDDLVGRPFIQLVEESDRAAVAEVLEALASERDTQRFLTLSILDGEGLPRTVEWHFHITHNVEGWEHYLFGIGIDIHERTLAEKQLHLFQSIVQASSEAISIATPEGRLQHWNQAHAELFRHGLPETEAAPLNYRDYCRGETLATYEQEVQARLAVGETWEGVLEVARGEAEDTFQVWARFDAIRDGDGKHLLNFAMMHDVSAQQRMQEALDFERNQYETIFNAAPMMVLYKDRNFQVIRANQYAKEVIGHNPEVAPKASNQELLTESTSQYHGDDREVIETGQPKLGIIERSRGRYYQTDKVPFRDGNGEIAGVIVFAMDITNYLEARKDLQDNEARLIQIERDCTEGDRLLAGVMSHIKVGIGITDRHGRFVYINDACSLFFGYSEAEMLDRRFITIFPHTDHSVMLRRYFSFVSEPEGATLIDSRKAVHQDGGEFDIRFTAHCLKWNDGEVYVLWMLEKSLF